MLFYSFCLRIIHSSDTHGWLFGDPHDEVQNAGMPGILAYIRHNKENETTFAFDSGDFIEGCGLSDAEDNVGDFVYQMWHSVLSPGQDYYNAVTIGNHDMQIANVAPWLYKYYFQDPGMKDVFTSTNTFVKSNSAEPNSKFRRTENNGMTTFVQGYIYSFTAKSPFYVRNLVSEYEGDQEIEYRNQNEKPDFFTVLFHYGYNSHPEQFYLHYEHIREYTDAPIIVLGGHEHQTAYDYQIDIDKIQSRINEFNVTVNRNWKGIFATTVNAKGETIHYDKNFVVAETLNYYKNISVIDIEFEDYLTPQGNKLIKSVVFNERHTNIEEFASEFSIAPEEFLNEYEQNLNTTIFNKVNELKLLDIIGTAPERYYSGYNSHYDTDNTSIWNLWFYDIVPKILYQSVEYPVDQNRTYSFAGKSFFVNDILEGDIFNNDLYVTLAYKDEFFWIYKNMRSEDLKKAYSDISGSYYDHPHIKDLKDGLLVDLVISDYDGAKFEQELQKYSLPYEYEEFGTMCPFDVYNKWVLDYWPAESME